MGASVSRQDFTFSYTDEPHATRRKLILAKYPQVKKLMGVDEMFKYQVVAIVLAQFASFYLLRNTTNFWLLLTLAYFVGGTANHALMLAIHELSHSMGFGPGRPLANKLLGMFANLPIGAPIVISFKKYHLDHHRYQGDELLDTDVPTYFEVWMFRWPATKLLWCFLQPLFYTMRPFLVNPKRVEALELVNIAVQLTFDYVVYKTLGAHIVYYMLAGSALAMGLHPCAGHFISEHFLIFQQQQQQHQQDTNSKTTLTQTTSSTSITSPNTPATTHKRLQQQQQQQDCNSNNKKQQADGGFYQNGNSSSSSSVLHLRTACKLDKINEDDETSANTQQSTSSLSSLDKGDLNNNNNDNDSSTTNKAVVVKNGAENKAASSTLKPDGTFLVPETCSYYGPLNWLTFNVGYHVEHHDFPSIPGSRLAELQRIAPEFYLTLNYHTSWLKVIWQYITDPRVGPAARVRRPTKNLFKFMTS